MFKKRKKQKERMATEIKQELYNLLLSEDSKFDKIIEIAEQLGFNTEWFPKLTKEKIYEIIADMDPTIEKLDKIKEYFLSEILRKKVDTDIGIKPGNKDILSYLYLPTTYKSGHKFDGTYGVELTIIPVEQLLLKLNYFDLLEQYKQICKENPVKLLTEEAAQALLTIIKVISVDDVLNALFDLDILFNENDLKEIANLHKGVISGAIDHSMKSFFIRANY